MLCSRTGLLAVSPAFAANGVSFSVPNNGASLSSPVHVEMKVQGLQVKPAGEQREAPLLAFEQQLGLKHGLW